MLNDLLDIKSANILVIDDEEINLEIVNETLSAGGYHNITLTNNPVHALEIYSKTPPDLVLLDIKMPGLSGFEVMQHMQAVNYQPDPPIIILTAFADKQTRLKALNNGARDFLSKPFDGDEALSRIRNLLEMHLAHKEIISHNQTLDTAVYNRTKELQKSRKEIIERLGYAAEFKDNETGVHTVRVGHFAECLALEIGFNDTEAENILFAAPMHDIGKIGIPDKVLLKPGKLDAEEWEIMKKHTEYGHQILKDSSCTFLEYGSIIALSHHEKWDGSGYPQGLKGTDIPIFGRITAVADVFDALTMDRPYKKAWSIEAAVELINEQSGKHFDPQLVDAFNKILNKFIAIKKEHTDIAISTINSPKHRLS
jgi:putative two-component system response regulator